MHTLCVHCVVYVNKILHHAHLPCFLQEKGVGKDAAWSALLARQLFAKAAADTHRSASLQHLENIFAERSHLLYKAADVQASSWF